MSKKGTNYIRPNFIHQTQETSYDSLIAQNYHFVDTTIHGIQMEKIDKDGFVSRVVIDLNGFVRKYKPFKPSPFESASLPKDSEKMGDKRKSKFKLRKFRQNGKDKTAKVRIRS